MALIDLPHPNELITLAIRHLVRPGHAPDYERWLDRIMSGQACPQLAVARVLQLSTTGRELSDLSGSGTILARSES